MGEDAINGEGVAQGQPAAFLTVKDLQAELRIGEAFAYRLLKSGKIPSVRIGRAYRIPRARLEEALGICPGLGKQA